MIIDSDKNISLLMKLLFLLFTQSLIYKCGHIFIDDIHLTYQNEGFIQGIHFYFSL